MEDKLNDLSKKEAFERYQQEENPRGRIRTPEEWNQIITNIIFVGKVAVDISALDLNEGKLWNKCFQVLRKRLIKIIDLVRKKRGVDLDVEVVLQEFSTQPFFTVDEQPGFKELLIKTCSVDPSLYSDNASSQSLFFPSQASQSSEAMDQTPATEPVAGPGSGRRRVPFLDLKSDRSKLRRTDEITASIKEFAEANGLGVDTVLGMIGHRYYYPADRDRARIFGDIADGKDPFKPQRVDPNLALYIKSRAEIGKKVYTDIRMLMKKMIIWPPYKDLQTLSTNLVPPVEPFMHGIKAKMSRVLSTAVEGHLEAVKLSNEQIMWIEENGLVTSFAYGGDASGSHSEYNSRDCLEVDTSHMIISGLHIKTIAIKDVFGTQLYKEESAAPHTEHPLCIVPGKEDQDNFGDIMRDLERQVLDIRANPVPVRISSVLVVPLSIDEACTQLDGKALKVISGLGGAFCTACPTSQADAQKIDKLNAGFPCTTTLAGLRVLFNELAVRDEDDNLVLPRQAGDYATRRGLTHEPMMQSIDTSKVIPVLHAWPRTLSLLERLAYRLNSRHAFPDGKPEWGGRGIRITPEGKAAIAQAKNDFRAGGRSAPLNLKLDCPDASGHGGNSDTANTARCVLTVLTPAISARVNLRR